MKVFVISTCWCDFADVAESEILGVATTFEAAVSIAAKKKDLTEEEVAKLSKPWRPETEVGKWRCKGVSIDEVEIVGASAPKHDDCPNWETCELVKSLSEMLREEA